MTTQKLQTLFDTFLKAKNNTYVKVLPNKYPPQCFDLAVEWTNRLGVPHYTGNPSPFPYPNAYQIYTDYGPYQQKYFERIPNTPDYVPEKGDIVVWAGSYNGGIGHVAIATGEGDTNTFQAFSQNVPLNSLSRVLTFNYNHVLGALRYKTTQDITNPQPPMDDNIKRKSYFFDLYWHALYGDNVDTDKVTKEQVEARIREAKSEKYRSGEWDKLARMAGFTGDTSSLIRETLYQLISRQAIEEAQGDKKAVLAEMKSLCLQLDTHITHLLDLE